MPFMRLIHINVDQENGGIPVEIPDYPSSDVYGTPSHFKNPFTKNDDVLGFFAEMKEWISVLPLWV